MEEIKAALTKFETTLALLLGQMVDVREDVKKVSDKVVSLKEAREKVIEVAPQSKPLTPVRTEYELKEIARLPDCVKELHVFRAKLVATTLGWVERRPF